MQEVWKEIKDFEDQYLISNFGRIKSLKFDKIRKTTLSQHGYEIVILTKNYKVFRRKVHRLVAQAFLPNPKNLPMINHKDLKKLNNKLENLEWCTVGENTRHWVEAQKQREQD